MDANISQPIFLSVSDACRLLGLRRTSLYALLKSGQLRAVKIGARRLIPRDELERFAAAVKQGAA